MTRILLVKTSSLGDVVHNLPVIRDIRRSVPDVEIDWVVEEGFADIPAMHAGVDEVHGVALRRWRHSLFSSTTRYEISELKTRLQNRAYDTVIDTQGLLKSAWVAHWAPGIRHGQHRSTVREPLAALFYNRHHHIPRGQHAVERNRQLVAKALGYEQPKDPPIYGIVAPTQEEDQTIASPYIVCLHGTAQARKLWPENQWQLLGKLLNDAGITVVFPWGSEAERERSNRYAAQLAAAHVSDRMSVGQLATLMGQASAVIGVDTGLAHLAVALGKPTIGIYTDTDPALTGLYAGEGTPVANLGGVGETVDAAKVLQVLLDWKVVGA